MQKHSEKIGILFINLGSPKMPTFWSVRSYLAEFLTDQRVIEWPKALWYPILYGIILNVRPRRSGENYKRIWDEKNQQAPLITYTLSLEKKIAALFNDDRLVFATAMRYGEPSIAGGIKKLIEQKCTRILAFPLYPQYSSATTGTVCEALFDNLKKRRDIPALRLVPPYPTYKKYIEALAKKVMESYKRLPFKPEKLLVSFHGLPSSYIKRGDPYQRHCEETFAALVASLDFKAEDILLTYQSRFGPEEWLKPYTSDTVEALAKKGIKSLAIVAPGFACDCLETLDELVREVAEVFYENGGQHFTYIPCLNDSEEATELGFELLSNELKGWYPDCEG